MKIWEKVFPSGDSCRSPDRLTACFGSWDGNPFVAFTLTSPSTVCVSQDEARRLARAILALPRPIDAPPEEVP